MITPHIDKLASQSLVFERAFTNYAYCCPSRNSFMSGRMPGTPPPPAELPIDALNSPVPH